MTAVFAELPWIYFEGDGAALVARYGDPALSAPHYDLEATRFSIHIENVPDATWGEVVCAVVVARPGHQPPDLERLRAHCTGRLAGFKQPRRLEVADAIPRTAGNGNVQRRLLVERIASAPR